ncbi:uncharacterized protein LOC124813524 [Hydra vulgaris]|uniref:uncharacterized protein LOC124813524 n=1 Tax=Hydra vulgaris TaxID=6087 RepID=UPI001F5EB8B1|nr:uncharacterized protein LOC124813524 [Hydra vulgaris]XP_047136644.1 uncharacterized protein LOC124813524 [Hydra vulgaris]XP_047136645.1 uncharacterized protein LOC124813524 [Hydra vulgaris]XP_047136646.1 uncharacterized protein LOC124813524 [Hydra vulgaris]XP_047136647.1 uncharacterized protein LOC124813524 [Hydra vulgaris]XP_047136648.1 uncharacterized protein LOC124813524 [Hydra vulgaris]XP_047136649.1 uncharacterized protein LOC124813524 [Hydra vulgaris]XP_047136650.1 uncharacterized p
MVNVNQGDNLSNSCMTFSIQPVALCNSTVKERYNTALSHLQPLASILSEFTPSKFDLAIKWLESVCQQCISGEWELQVQQHHSEDDVISENNFEINVEIFPECSSATLECVLPVSPQVSLQTNSVATSNISPTITCETLHVERLQTNVEIFPESSLSATLECVLPVSPQISIQTNLETTSKNFPTITCETLPVEKRCTTRILEDIDIILRKPQRFPPGRPAVKKQRLFYNVTKPLEKLGVYEKDFIRLTWFVKDSIAQNSLQSGSKISINDLSSTVPYIINDKRANLHELEQYFDESAWAEIVVRCKSTSSDSWPCYHCQQIQSASKLQKWIQCDHCLYWYHYYCVGISRKPKGH